MTTWRKLLLPVAGLMAANLAFAADVDGAVNKAAAVYMAAPEAAGLSVGVIHAGKSYRYHFGKDKPNDGTIYPIASLTKTFTGLLLAQASLEKKLALDDDVRQYLGAGYDNLAYEQQPVRLYHLVNHRSGLPFALISRDELRKVKLTTAPGTNFQYSNAAAQLAGEILEVLYGQNYETLVKQRVAKPLGMQDITVTLSPEQQRRLAVGYDEKGARQAYQPDESQAAGALKATLPDMLAYARAQLAESDAAIRLSHQPTYVSGDYSVGLNWQMLREGQRRVLWQDGAIPGFASLFVLQPESDIAIVLFSNELDRQTLSRLRTLANTVTRDLTPLSIRVP